MDPAADVFTLGREFGQVFFLVDADHHGEGIFAQAVVAVKARTMIDRADGAVVAARRGLEALKQHVVGGQFLARRVGLAGSMGAYDAVVDADQRDRTHQADVDLAIEAREIGRVDRDHDHAFEAAVAGDDGARILDRPFARRAADQRLAHERAMRVILHVHLDVGAVRQIDRLEVLHRGGAQDAFVVHRRDLHEHVERDGAVARELVEVDAEAFVRDAFADQLGQHIGLLERTLHVLGQDTGQDAGIALRIVGVVAFALIEPEVRIHQQGQCNGQSHHQRQRYPEQT